MLPPVSTLPELVAGLTAGGCAGLLPYVHVVDKGPDGEEAGDGEGDGGAGDVEELLAAEGHLGGSEGEGDLDYGGGKCGGCGVRGRGRVGDRG